MKLIELHILQSFPVSCLNRDDVGAPKTATFGGATRARISSQCLKRAIRELAKAEYPNGRFTGIRTKLIAAQIQKALEDGHKLPAARALDMACAVAGLLNKKDGKPLPTDDPELETLFFASPNQITALADLAFKEFGAKGEIKADKKKFVKACLDVGVHDAADIALFGTGEQADGYVSLVHYSQLDRLSELDILPFTVRASAARKASVGRRTPDIYQPRVYFGLPRYSKEDGHSITRASGGGKQGTHSSRNAVGDKRGGSFCEVLDPMCRHFQTRWKGREGALRLACPSGRIESFTDPRRISDPDLRIWLRTGVARTSAWCRRWIGSPNPESPPRAVSR